MIIWRKFRIAIKVLDEDLRFFEHLLEEYPEDITVSYDTGADGLSIVQVIIDVTNVMVPAVVSVVGLLLTYKAQIKTEQLHQKELELKEKEIELNAQAKEEVEIRVTNSGETSILIKSNDLKSDGVMKDSVDAIVNRVREALENESS